MTEERWTRLVRFEADEDGSIYYGSLITENPRAPYTGSKARLIEGEPLGEYTLSQSERTIKRLLSPLAKESVPIVRMIGLNYVKHLLEGSRPLPKSPCLFIVGSDTVNGPFDDVNIPVCAQDGFLDYEGELVIVIGKSGRDIPKEDAESYIAGYAVGNDVSSRRWQRENGTQWCFSKGFDGFGPFGPWIQSRDTVDLSTQSLTVYVNDESTPRQSSPLTDMIFSASDIVAFLSQGTTLKAGTLIFTGTPHGVGYAMDPPGFLNDGDVVKVSIQPDLGEIANKMNFERSGTPVLFRE